MHDLRNFLGMVNLHEYMKETNKMDRRLIDWTDAAIRSSEKCNFDLVNVALSAYPNPEIPLALCTDASYVAKKTK